MQDSYVFVTLLTIALITIFLRAFPIIIVNKIKNNNFCVYLSKRMPVGVMLVLVVYTLKDHSFTSGTFGIPLLVSCIVSIMLYMHLKNALISIFGSLFIYLLITNWNIFIEIIV